MGFTKQIAVKSFKSSQRAKCKCSVSISWRVSNQCKSIKNVTIYKKSSSSVMAIYIHKKESLELMWLIK